MKILIDENLPVKLKKLISSEHTVYTVAEKKWNSYENGELLKLMQDEGFDFLITADKSIPHQQSIEKYKINLIIVRGKDNRIESIAPLNNKINDALKNKSKLIAIVE